MKWRAKQGKRGSVEASGESGKSVGQGAVAT